MSTTTTARSVPAGRAVALVYRVVLRQLISRGRLIALTLLALISTVAGAALGAAEEAGLGDAVDLVAGLGLGLVLPVVALVFGGAAIGDLRDDKTLVYLWLRPMDRWPVVVGAAAAALTLSAPVTLVPVSLGAALTGFGGDLVVATILAGLVGLVGYTALFTFFGISLRRFIVWGLAYILIWEGFVSAAGTGVARFTILRYTRSILSERTGADVDLAGATQLTGIVVPLLAAAAFVALGAWRLGRQDID
jgi:ABC-2 type transport system permease protein